MHISLRVFVLFIQPFLKTFGTQVRSPTFLTPQSRAPRFSHYISSISTSVLRYMNEIILQEGGRAIHFRKSDMFPPGVQKALIVFLCASQQQRRKAGFMIPRFTGSLMRATALSCLCGIKAASISAAVREGVLGIGWQRSDSSTHSSNHSLTALEVNQQHCRQTPRRLGEKGWCRANVIRPRGFVTEGVDHSRSSYPVFNVRIQLNQLHGVS